jgi:hypothetical protein
LELGKHLVTELDLEEGRDTLAKWLAHHVAELISVAEKARQPKEKKAAEDHVVETILKLWQHRATLPGNANPLAPYRNILGILSQMAPAPDRWPTLVPNHPMTKLYTGFPRLMHALIVRHLPRTGKERRESSEIVHKFLESDESRLLRTFQVKFICIGQEDPAASLNKAHDEFDEVDQLTLKLIEETIKDLEELRTLPGSGTQQTKKKAVSRRR